MLTPLTIHNHQKILNHFIFSFFSSPFFTLLHTWKLFTTNESDSNKFSTAIFIILFTTSVPRMEFINWGEGSCWGKRLLWILWNWIEANKRRVFEKNEDRVKPKTTIFQTLVFGGEIDTDDEAATPYRNIPNERRANDGETEMLF